MSRDGSSRHDRRLGDTDADPAEDDQRQGAQPQRGRPEDHVDDERADEDASPSEPSGALRSLATATSADRGEVSDAGFVIDGEINGTAWS